eukprot:CAMPEP_0196803128 /NCGR_PEP_ID=MMETSP1362-20130617/2545_1 /TAXON_ID=163516 /ORGANISM="Leptocylindrus danicus, Strain CCMP1856" /LENGTH=254 /DNA_ID=CAMNT_0042174571 /DNA_START=100 /DNA_END=864 /DNA_ORIENTATION=+
MADNKLRCVLVYRLDSSAAQEPTVLAKYDHAAQYETTGGTGTDDASLYGGRDKNYADAVAAILSSDPPASSGDASVIGGFKVVESTVHQVTYGADGDGRCLAVITGLQYPSRVAVQMITELHKTFIEKFGLMAMSATTNSLTKKATPMLKEACKKYDDLSSVDKTSSVLEKVEGVKIQMQDNIAAMLVNTETAEELQDKSSQLNEQASVFKKNSTTLKKHMKCKNLKMTILLVLVVVGVLAIILVPLILRAQDD